MAECIALKLHYFRIEPKAYWTGLTSLSSHISLIFRDHFAFLNSEIFFLISFSSLQLWPGYATAIAQFDGGTLLCADVSHKVMRLNSVLDLLYELYNSVDPRNFHNLAVKKLVGEIVITRYFYFLLLKIVTLYMKTRLMYT